MSKEPHSVKELKNKHPGIDMYVVGSGASFGFIDKAFFANKIVLCINNTIAHVPKAKHLYLVAKEPDKKSTTNSK